MFVVDQGGVDPRARLMVDGEVAPVRIAAKQVEFLFVDDQFLGERRKKKKKKKTREENPLSVGARVGQATICSGRSCASEP